MITCYWGEINKIQSHFVEAIIVTKSFSQKRGVIKLFFFVSTEIPFQPPAPHLPLHCSHQSTVKGCCWTLLSRLIKLQTMSRATHLIQSPSFTIFFDLVADIEIRDDGIATKKNHLMISKAFKPEQLLSFVS